MQKQKLLIIQYTLAGGGAEKVLSDVLNRFDYERFDVTLLLFQEYGIYLPTIPKEVKIKAVNPVKLPFLWKLIFNRWSFRFLPEKLMERMKLLRALGLRRKYDCIVSFMEGWGVNVHSKLMARGRRNVSWVHIDLLANHYSAGFFENSSQEAAAYAGMDEIVFVSNSARDAFFKLFGRDFPSRVVYNLIEKDNIIKRSGEQCPISKTHEYVLCNVGRLTAQKRQDRLIRVVAKLWHDYGMDVEAWIAGEGELEQTLKSLAKNLGVEDRIVFCGFQSNPYPLIKNSDAFVLTSDSEGFSLVVAEALAIGKPVMSTKVTGPTELLEKNSGILTSTEEDEIAREIKMLLEDKTKYAFYESQALKRSEIFQADDAMDKIYSVISGKRS